MHWRALSSSPGQQNYEHRPVYAAKLFVVTDISHSHGQQYKRCSGTDLPQSHLKTHRQLHSQRCSEEYHRLDRLANEIPVITTGRTHVPQKELPFAVPAWVCMVFKSHRNQQLPLHWHQLIGLELNFARADIERGTKDEDHGQISAGFHEMN